MTSDLKIDIHQHLWSDELLIALGRRNDLPFARRNGDDWIVHSAGESPYVVSDHERDPWLRAEQLRDAGIDRAVIAPSSPIGMEDLPVNEALPLLDAHIAGVRALPGAFGHWAVASVWRSDPDRLAAQLDAGAVGLALPAGALAAPEGWERVARLLDLLEQRELPLFVHPGPGPHSELAVGEPQIPWWPALTRYVAEVAGAWFAFGAVAGHRHPRLRVVFALLAGLAPLQHERLAARGGAISLRDPRVFYETSSYGAESIRAIAGLVGRSQIVFGSDAPMTDPEASEDDALLIDNPARLLGLEVAR